jgi:hypothetical protein
MLICGLVFGGRKFMYREYSWKRIITLCFTFWLGIFISGFFVENSPPIKEANNEFLMESAINATNETSKCFPSDEDLKFLLLKNSQEKSKEKTKIKKRADNTCTKKEPCTIDGEENQKITKDLEKQLYRPSKNELKYQKLPYNEVCYESDGRK